MASLKHQPLHPLGGIMLQKTSVFFLALLCFFSMASASFAEKLQLTGSTTVLPVAQKVAEAYMKMRPDIEISLSGGGSGNGIKAIIDGTTDFGNASRFIKDSEVQAALEKKVYPVPFRIALDCIVPIVNPQNPVRNLSIEELRGIYTGKIKNWKEVGGKDMTIVVISRDSSSGTFETWGELVMARERVQQRALTVPSNGGLVQAVSKSPGAIGYIALGYVSSDLKALSVNGIPGTPENTLNGRYPLARELFMFTRGWPEGAALDFINFIFSPGGQALVREAGSIPVYALP